MKRYSISTYDGGSSDPTFETIPDECPICHQGIDPIFCYGKGDQDALGIEIVFACPKVNCHSLFISRYKCAPNFSNTRYIKSVPVEEQNVEFSEVIKNISPLFIEIYNQSNRSEQLGLDQICGVGYRKSIEFLIKDYLISKYEEQTEVIKKTNLAKCIEQYIDNKMIKDIASRAVWLGNDETHYFRKWEEKDIKDLKKLIMMIVNLFENEFSYQEILIDMPQGK